MEISSPIQCLCGEWVELRGVMGLERAATGEATIPMHFDEDRFVEDFLAHVSADPECGDHILFDLAPYDS